VGENSNYPRPHIYRTNVSDNTEELVADFSPQDLSDAHEFTVVPTLNRWYFHFEGCGNNAIVCAGNENLGFADATFTITGSTLYGSAFLGPSGGASLYMLDQNMGLATLIGPIGFNQVGGIDFDPLTGVLYGTGKRASDSTFVTITINPETGAGTEVGVNSTAFQDISFRSDGTLFGYGGGNIYTLDTGTGASSLVGNTGAGFPDGNGLAFSPSGTLYSVNQSGEVTINQSTGAATHVTNMSYPNPPLNINPRANGMDFDLSGILWASVANGNSSNVTNYLTTINPTNGQVAIIGQTVKGLDALAVQSSTFVISVSASPVDGGTVTGGGNYNPGATATVIATPNNCYQFVNWTENGNEVSTSSSYSFTVTANRTLVANFSKIQYSISASASPTAGGSVTGAGTYDCGSTAMLHALANSCYHFVNWTENGNEVSTSADYSFTVSGDRTLVANFALNNYTISATANPSGSGSVSGTGNYNCGSTVTLHATANNCYGFANWTENGVIVSTSSTYSFTASANRTLIANFTKNDNSAPQITVPENIVTKAQKKRVNGQKGAFVFFSVSATDQDDGNVPAFANPPSGSFFPVGTTTVNVTSTDDCNNTGMATFTVTVKTGKH